MLPLQPPALFDARWASRELIANPAISNKKVSREHKTPSMVRSLWRGRSFGQKLPVLAPVSPKV
jgi:hypothetical protein